MTNTANIGEWSELYALGVMLGKGGMFASDEDQNINKDIFYKIIEAYIDSTLPKDTRKYVPGSEKIQIYNGNNELLAEATPSNIISLSEQIFSKLSVHQEGRAFSLKETEELIESLKVIKLKAASAEKSDLALVLEDNQTEAITPKSGFSIKSQIGAPATLINASDATNFTYNVIGSGSPQGFIPKQVKKNTQAMYDQDFSLEFEKADSDTYTRNMRLIDSNLPNYIADLLVGFYRRRGGSIADVIDDVFKTDKEQKTLKIKEFLAASALGMMPNTNWDGQITKMGGFILVKRTGEVLCFYLYNNEDFQNYLLKHTKFDTPSTTRYPIGKLLNTGGKLQYKLNLQVRFKS